MKNILYVLSAYFAFVLTGYTHAIWNQRNEPGPWTVVLYHCDDTGVSIGQSLFCEVGGDDYHLQIGGTDGDGLFSTTDTAREVLVRSVEATSPQELVADGLVAHPTEQMSIECWLRFAEFQTDVQFGFINGVSMRIRIGDEGDRFQLIGANTTDMETTEYSAPGFISFPPVTDWHHIGITISAPNIETMPNGNYRYGEGCTAEFFYDSHIVGFQGNQTLDLTGLEFAPSVQPAVIIHSGTFLFDEFMISNVDWSNPVGHGGSGHDGSPLTHGFEDGRTYAAVNCWEIY